MSRKFKRKSPLDFSFRQTVEGHGWYDLAPFEWDDQNEVLEYTFLASAGGPVTIRISCDRTHLLIDPGSDIGKREALDVACRVLRMDEDISGFYAAAADDPDLLWAVRSNAGRLLRSATVFEDVVKSICTTNCSWELTRKMVQNLVDRLGEPSPSGRRAFPTAKVMASLPQSFYRSEIKAGYRSPYLLEFAEKVAGGALDPESWIRSTLSTAELKEEIKRVKGVGNYAAENLLKLLGRYDGLALDSWLRSQFYERRNRGRTCRDSKIERHYRRYGRWKGLAIWCDLTAHWFEKTQDAP